MTNIELSKNINTKILTIRNTQVILDRDLAILYEVETRTLNQAVKRNIKRFPEEFMFQLTKNELEVWMSQIVISKKETMGIRKMPFAFTEQGVSMLSAILKSDTAIDVSIKIIKSFVQMRKFLSLNAGVFQRLEKLETGQKQTNVVLEKVLDAIEDKSFKPKQGIFYDGQIFDAYKFVADIIKSAEESIVLIDNFIDETVLVLLSKRKPDVKATIYSSNITKQLKLDIERFNAQYSSIEIRVFNKSHDRFLIIDNKTVYHIGASLKDLGKKWFAFSKINIDAGEMIRKLQSTNYTN
ncbi:MAG: ORF6N domain-containing protein [Bacteroidetes bacterium]|nr:ORF6N domain-containing protein [Bacteroidota bacterium]